MVTVLLLTWAYQRISFSVWRETLLGVELGWVAAFVFLLFVNTGISTLKWQKILQADGVQIRFWRLFGSYMIGTFMNLFMPSTIGGDAYRLKSIGADASMAKSLSSILADRLSGFLAMMLIGLGCALAAFNVIGDAQMIWIPAALFLILVTGIIALLVGSPVRWGMRLFRLDKIPKLYDFMDRCLQSFSMYRSNRALLMQTLGLSFVFQFLLVCCIALLARGLGIEISLLLFFVFVPLITLLEAIPLSIFGLGWRDWGYVWFFTVAEVPDPVSVAAAFVSLYLGLTVLYASMGGVLLLFRLRGQPGQSAEEE